MDKFVLVDSNILVYAINNSSPKHQKAQNFLHEHQKQLALAHQNILETMRVLTHPKFSCPMKPAEAEKALTAIANACYIITPDKTAHYSAMQFVKKYDLSGDKIFDAYLAATALSNGISTLATDNTKDFKTFEGLRLVNPFV